MDTSTPGVKTLERIEAERMLEGKPRDCGAGGGGLTSMIGDCVAGGGAIEPLQGVLLEDVQAELGRWLAPIMHSLDHVLCELGDDNWAEGTRKIVVDHISLGAVNRFVEDDDLIRMTDPDEIQTLATSHLAHYVICKAREIHARANPTPRLAAGGIVPGGVTVHFGSGEALVQRVDTLG